MKKMKKVLSVILAVVVLASLCVCFAACTDKGDTDLEIELPAYSVDAPDYSSLNIPDTFKIGMLCLHDKNSTYDKNFIEAMEAVQKELGLKNSQVVIYTGVPEGGDDCYQKACQLAEDGCNIIFADSFGHEDHMIKAAKKYPNILFAHATGTKAHTENLPNYVNAFAAIYEGRFLAGVAAGLKIKEMIANGTVINGTKVTAETAHMGYVGAYTYAEVISGYTSFYLGAKSVCPSVTMDVTFTGSWYDETAEKQGALNLINNKKCILISQHADSMGAPNACEEKGVPNVSYNGSTVSACPNTFIVSSRINWAPYYKYIISETVKGNMTSIQKDYVGDIKSGSVVLTNFGKNATAEGTVEKIVELRDQLANGTLHVFDTAKDNFITVGGEKMTSYKADGREVVADGYFHESESEYRSAPYFDVKIDGINLLDVNYGD